MDISLEQFRQAEKIISDYKLQEFNKISDNINKTNEELYKIFSNIILNGSPVVIFVNYSFEYHTGNYVIEIDSNMEEDFDSDWWDIITPILSKYNITNYRKGNKYM